MGYGQGDPTLNSKGENQMEHRRLYKQIFSIGTVLLCFLLLLPALRFLPAGAQSQPATDVGRDEFDARIQFFFETLRRVGSVPAFDELLRGSPLGTSDANAPLTNLRNRVDGLQADFGDILNWEKLETKRVGTSIVLVRYVLMYDRYPVVWTFTFYRKPPTTPSVTALNQNLWLLVELHFDTDTKSLF